MPFKRIIPEEPTKSKELRCSTRHKVKTLAYLDLGLDNGGTLINISEGGLSFQGIQPLELSQMLPIDFKLPGIDQSFKATGQVVWLCDSRKGGGLQFIELPEKTRNLIHRWDAGMVLDDLGGLPTGPSGSMNDTLADLLRDSSLSRDAVIAAVNASRSKTIAVHSTDSRRALKIQQRTPVKESDRTNLPTAPLRMPHREQALKVSSAVSEDRTLGLKVERTGDDWQVRWNRKSDFLAKAVSGSLSITDGAFRKELEIDVSELRSGSIIYRPATDNVILRLQVITENSGQPISETVRIVACKAL